VLSFSTGIFRLRALSFSTGVYTVAVRRLHSGIVVIEPHELPVGATDLRQYGGTSAVMQFQGTWLVLVTGGGPTPDKPTITFRPPTDTHTVSHELTIKVPDCWDAYQVLVGRGVEFLSPPVEYDWEIRCFFRDPDGHLLEISQTKT
jgi:catechol 2,3-dioxygenase-like lactoylglutathione lyase family enzyme